MEERLACLEQRLAEAERQVRALRVVARVSVRFALGTVAVGLALAGARPAQTREVGSVVRAPFRVVDGKGKTLLAVDVGTMGSWDELSGSRLRLFDARGKATATLTSSDDGGALGLDTRLGERSVGLFAGATGGTLKIVYSPEVGQPAAVLGAHTGGSMLSLYDREGTRTAQLEATRQGQRVILRSMGKVEFVAP